MYTKKFENFEVKYQFFFTLTNFIFFSKDVINEFNQ